MGWLETSVLGYFVSDAVGAGGLQSLALIASAFRWDAAPAIECLMYVRPWVGHTTCMLSFNSPHNPRNSTMILT